MKSPDSLKRYREKRDFSITPEAATSGKAHPNALEFVVRKHWEHDCDTVKDLSARIVQHMASTFPQLLVAKSGPSNRVGRIFIDYLRNGFGTTTVCALPLHSRCRESHPRQ